MSAEKSVVAVDVPCVSCGYNLRTLPADARCTECGTAVAESLEKTILRWGPAYVRRMGAAASAAARLNIAALGVTMLFIGVMFTLDVSGYRGNRGFVLVLVFAGYTTIAFLHATNAWRLTDIVPVPAISLLKPVIRGSSVVFIGATFAPLSVAILATSRNDPPLGPLAFLLIGWALLLPSLPIYIGTSGRYFAGLCQYGGLLQLAPWHRHTSALLASGIGLIWLMFASFALKLILEGPDSPPARTLLICMQLFVMSGLVIAGVTFLMATGLLMITARRLRKLASGVVEGQPLCASVVPESSPTDQIGDTAAASRGRASGLSLS